MKKFLALILLVPGLAFGQGWQVPYPAGTPRALPTPGTVMTKANVDVYGNQLVGLSNGGVQSASNAVKLEDSVAASGDAAVSVVGVTNEAFSQVVGGVNGDYFQPAGSSTGVLFTAPVYDINISSGRTPITREDNAAVTGDALVGVAYEARDPLAILEETADYTSPKVDLLGRVITTLAPAGETWQACSAVVTDTTNTLIKSAVASNKFYVTSITCTNTSAVASQIQINESTTPLWYGGVGTSAATGGVWNQTWAVPIRATTLNTALNFQMTTTGTSTRCCASGYISVN